MTRAGASASVNAGRGADNNQTPTAAAARAASARDDHSSNPRGRIAKTHVRRANILSSRKCRPSDTGTKHFAAGSKLKLFDVLQGPGMTMLDNGVGRRDTWMAAMRRGDFARAWQISDADLRARLARGVPFQTGPRHLQSIWNGEPLAGKRVLVRCYHGLGDTIQFIRFAAPLQRLAKEVIVWAPRPLVRLIGTAAGVDRLLRLHDGVPGVDCDCDIEIMELAHALRVDARSITCPVPY